MTSHTIGDCQRPWMMTFINRSGRPRSTTTNRAPVIKATAVMNSAMRVTGVRQVALETRRMAEMSVPAWLMPMKNTNIVM